ncbi:unnamed protein product [Mytilus edulis]|uniref:Uncharacterized protein n=1 Tax=Mytilus edulis TaxID=6550 RepID=A0A8S3TST5_MYTED|nr:unnamed protein product [Mytilus edulis]
MDCWSLRVFINSDFIQVMDCWSLSIHQLSNGSGWCSESIHQLSIDFIRLHQGNGLLVSGEYSSTQYRLHQVWTVVSESIHQLYRLSGNGLREYSSTQYRLHQTSSGNGLLVSESIHQLSIDWLLVSESIHQTDQVMDRWSLRVFINSEYSSTHISINLRLHQVMDCGLFRVFITQYRLHQVMTGPESIHQLQYRLHQMDCWSESIHQLSIDYIR